MGYTAKEFLEVVDRVKELAESGQFEYPYEIRDAFIESIPDLNIREEKILSILCDEWDNPYVIWTPFEEQAIEYIIYRLRDGM